MKWILYVVGLILGVVTPFILLSGEVFLCVGGYGAGVGLILLAVIAAVLTWLCLRPVFSSTGTPPTKGPLLARGIAIVAILAATTFLVSSRWNAANYHLDATNSRIKDALEALRQGRVYLNATDCDAMKRTINSCGLWVPSEKKAHTRESLLRLQRGIQEHHERRRD